MLISSVRSALQLITSIILPALPLLLSSCSDGVNDPTVPDTYFVLDGVVPAAAYPGDYVIISIRSALADTSEFSVKIAGQPAEIISLNPVEIVAVVPEGARGNNITVTRRHGATMFARTESIPFQVIDSPYRFNATDLHITGITGISEQSYSFDNGVAGTRSDTSELEISNFQMSVFGPDGIFCDEYTNGDTIRICTRTRSSDGSGWELVTCAAIIDGRRGVISRMELHRTWTWPEYTSPLQQKSKTGGARIVLRDVPYTLPDSGGIRVHIVGSDIVKYIVSYEFSSADNKIDGARWATSTSAIHKLLYASDEAFLKIRFFKFR